MRTDDTPLGIVYDPVHGMVFASNYHLNRVVEINPRTAQIVKSIPVPAPVGVSLSADKTRILVGSYSQELNWIDTTSLEVVERDIIPPLAQTPAGPSLVQTGEPFQAANGKVLLFAFWGYGDLQGTYFTGPDPVAEWDPGTGTVVARPDSGGGGIVSASADHSKILVGGQGGPTVYDSATDTFTQVAGYQSGVYVPAMNPSGTQFTLINGAPLFNFFNGAGSLIGTNNFLPNETLSNFGGRPSGATYSPDGKYLYVVLPTNLPLLVTVDAVTFNVVATATAYYSSRPFIDYQLAGVVMDADDTGLVFEIADHGVAINDATNSHNYPATSSALGSLIIATPSEGPLNASTIVDITTQAFSTTPAVYFGNQIASGVGYVSNGIQLQVASPPSNTSGAVNLKVITPDGIVGMMPQAFTYGSVPIQYGAFAAAPQGGGSIDLSGLGIGQDISGPTQVKIGAVSSPAVSFQGGGTSYAYPLQYLAATAPAGTPGTVEDITIASPSGSSVIPKAFHYLSSVGDYSNPDAFQSVLYDTHRNVVYLAASDHVDVFLAATNSFGTPIPVPRLGTTSQLTGMAMTPDGSKLLVCNQADASVAIINPDTPSSGAVAVRVPPAGTLNSPGPFQIAATGTNKAFIITTENQVSGPGGIVWELDLGTLALTPRTDLEVENAINYMASSADGNTIVIGEPNSSGGPVYIWRASTDAWGTRSLGQFINGIGISGDGNAIAVSSDPFLSDFPFPFLLDAALNTTAQVNYPDFTSPETGPPVLFEQTGALLYAMTPQGISIIDTRNDQLIETVVLTEPLQPFAVQAMALTPAGDRLFLLTATGITVVQLDAVPLAIGSVSPASGAPGTTVTLRGAGFATDTAVTVGSTAATATVVDPSTLTFAIPSVPSPGAVRITLTNPNGSKYSLDAALLVQ